MQRGPFLVWLASAAIALAGCPSATIGFGAEFDLELDASDFPVPPEVIVGGTAGGQVAEIPCPPVSCAEGTTCREGFCDPDPILYSEEIAEIDFAEIADEDPTPFVFDTIAIERVRYDIQRNDLGVTVSNIQVLWGPATANSPTDPGVGVLATVPDLAVGQTGAQEVTLDEAGNDAMTAYIVDVSSVVKFWIRAEVDVDPGDPVPENGGITAQVNMVLSASGSLR